MHGLAGGVGKPAKARRPAPTQPRPPRAPSGALPPDGVWAPYAPTGVTSASWEGTPEARAGARPRAGHLEGLPPARGPALAPVSGSGQAPYPRPTSRPAPLPAAGRSAP